MKWSFNPTVLAFGAVKVIHSTAQRVQEAEKDGKVDKHELSTIVLSTLGDVVSILASASMIDGKPLVGGGGDKVE